MGALLGFVAGLLTGGSLDNLLARRLRWPLVVVTAFAVKELLIRTALGNLGLAPAIFAASLAVLITWTLWHFSQLPGIWLVALGVGLNLVAVLANGGHMPVVPPAVHLGPPELGQHGVWAQYAIMDSGTRLRWLGDWILFPPPIDRLFPQAYSPGDLVSLLGVTLVLFLATRPVPPAARQGAITTR